MEGFVLTPSRTKEPSPDATSAATGGIVVFGAEITVVVVDSGGNVDVPTNIGEVLRPGAIVAIESWPCETVVDVTNELAIVVAELTVVEDVGATVVAIDAIVEVVDEVEVDVDVVVSITNDNCGSTGVPPYIREVLLTPSSPN